jgi:hypothetical protein
MKLNLLLCTSVLLTAVVAHADILTIGTPGDAYLATPTGPSPTLGNLINFDTTTACTSSPCSSLTVKNATFSSPDGLLVIPYSTQSYPNELFDDSSNGSANLTIKLSGGVEGIGVGIADSDPVTIYLQALNSSGVAFGTDFSVTIPENTDNPGNGYYVVSDTTADIFGLQITESVGNPNYSGLAIDDVQTTPEPSSYLLLGSCAALLFWSRMRKRA